MLKVCFIMPKNDIPVLDAKTLNLQPCRGFRITIKFKQEKAESSNRTIIFYNIAMPQKTFCSLIRNTR
jgi:hypothetical protein